MLRGIRTGLASIGRQLNTVTLKVVIMWSSLWKTGSYSLRSGCFPAFAIETFPGQHPALDLLTRITVFRQKCDATIFNVQKLFGTLL